ncbi:MAG: hypothetical protein DCC54_01500 [Anaerolineae bacterium]|nr:MAG: hypothetical protein DCC54_01500 [Anaerolineae bacterium]
MVRSERGVRFRRQQVIQGFIVDFYCHKSALVIEVDGDVHDLQKEEDERREPPLSFGLLRDPPNTTMESWVAN